AEEPLELRIKGKAVATLMRTPGADLYLAIGFLFTEGWISCLADVGSLVLCGRGRSFPAPGSPRVTSRMRNGELGGEQNVADLLPASGVRLRDPERRSLPVSSSCGVCGKRTIDEVLALSPLGSSRDGTRSAGAARRDALLSEEVLVRAPGKLKK